LGAAHLSIFITFTKPVCAWSVAELGSLSQELCRIFIVDKYDVVNAALVEQGQLMEGVRKLGSCVLGTSLEPFDAFFWTLREAEFAIEFSYAETIHGTRMEGGCRFTEELNGFG